MGRLEKLFYQLIERRRRGRLLIGFGLIGFFVVSLLFLAVGFTLISLRWAKSMIASAIPTPRQPLASEIKTAN